MWRIVSKGWARLTELDQWSFDDLMLANETLDAIEDAERRANK